MTEADGAGPAPAPCPAVEALRARGAHRSDPVRFRFVEALARRAAAQAGETRQRLEQRLAQAVADCGTRHDQARAEADAALQCLALRWPHAAADLQRLHAAGDFPGLRRLGAVLDGRAGSGLLAALVRHADQQAGEAADPRASGPGGPPAAAAPAGAPTELKALRAFRSTWSRLGADRQMRQSLAKAPDNAGPLNSHRLVLRALRTMQTLSPAYLQRFMAQVDALLWLEQADIATAPPAQPPPRGDGDRKRRPARGKAG